MSETNDQHEVAPGGRSWPNVHPDFDGHLEQPFRDLTAEQKLDWLWEMMCLRWEAQRSTAMARKSASGDPA